MTSDYSEIINMSRPISTRPKMPCYQRAKIFAPFAALKGYDDAIDDASQQRCNKKTLSEYELSVLNNKICQLKKDDIINITYFLHDSGSDGSGGMAEGKYLNATGTIIKLDNVYKVIRISSDNALGWIEIDYWDILDIQNNK